MGIPHEPILLNEGEGVIVAWHPHGFFELKCRGCGWSGVAVSKGLVTRMRAEHDCSAEAQP